MKNRISEYFALALLAASLVLAPAALAQSDSSLSASRTAGTVSGMGSNLSFPEIVDQDVAKGYYSATQGAQLKEQFEGVQERIDASMDKLQSSLAKTASIAESGNLDTKNQIDGIINSQGKAQLGGTPEEIAEQAKGIYNAAHMQLEVTQAVIDNAKPAVQDIMNEADQILATRADLIKNNPNLDSTVKNNVAKEASAVHDIADHGFEKGLSTLTYKLQTAQANLENNKSEIITQVENTITTNAPKYGSDPKNWPQTTPAKTPNTTSTQPNAATSVAQQPAANPAPASTNAAATTPSTGSGTHSASGTIPSNQPDPALSATRNSSGSQGTQSGIGSGGKTSSGTSNSGASKSTASNAAASNASSTSKSPAKTASAPASQTPSKPAAQNPSQSALQNNWNQAKNNTQNISQTKIPLEPIATPPPANTNAPKDPSGIALLNKPTPSNPSGTGKAVYNDTHTTPGGSVVLGVSSNSNKEALGGLPSYSQSGQGDQSQDQSGQAQNTETQPSTANTSNAGSTTSGTQPSVETTTEPPSSDNSTPPADTSTDASSSTQTTSQSKPVKVGTIPNSAPDPAFDAHRNDPNYDPNQADNSTASGNSGQAGATSATGDSASSPTSGGYPGGDAAAQANAQQSANNQAAKDSTASWEQTKADQQRAQDAEDARINAEIAKNFKPGKVGYLVEGDEGMEGTTDTTLAVEMPVITTADLSVEVGSTLTTASLSPIYKGYIVTPGQHGSSVIVAGTTQVQAPSAVLSAPSLQVAVPSSVMTAPSMQVQVPSAVMTVSSNQVQVPSDVMVVPSSQIIVPSSQINVPSSMMNSLDLQPALCGR